METIRPNLMRVMPQNVADLPFHRDGMAGLVDRDADRIGMNPEMPGEGRQRAELLAKRRLDILNVHPDWLSCHNRELQRCGRLQPAIFFRPAAFVLIEGTDVEDIRNLPFSNAKRYFRT